MQTIIITGASDGVGAASARQLTGLGEHVALVGRSRAKTAALAKRLSAPYHIADFSRLADVRRLARELARYARIDVLANNAGAIMDERALTVDGFEKTFQVNHLAPFLLTRLLLDRLVDSRAKVIQTVGVAANCFGRNFDVDDLNNERNYSPQTAYGFGKLENILFTRELHRRHGKDGVAAVAFHPGVVRSNFASDTSHALRFFLHSPLKYLVAASPEKGGQRLTAFAQGEPGRDWRSGEVYDKTKPMPVAFRDPDGAVARRLWEQSETLLQPWLEKGLG